MLDNISQMCDMRFSSYLSNTHGTNTADGFNSENSLYRVWRVGVPNDYDDKDRGSMQDTKCQRE